MVRLDAAIVAKAKLNAASQSLSLSEYLARTLAAPVERDFAKLVRKTNATEGRE